jgi:predicted CXXCH cytochrome family protein
MQLTGKQRSRRIDRGYFHKVEEFVTRKRSLSCFALVVGVLLSLGAFSGVWDKQVSTGDLSHAHAAWNQTGCENCHTANVPIRVDAWGGRSLPNIEINNQKCNGSCHQASTHYADASAMHLINSNREMPKVESCNECHREHLGSEFSLVELEDRTCTRCHSQMELVRNKKGDGSSVTGERPDPARVSGFSKDSEHPKFRGLDTDPGKIKFDHAQHLRLGQPSKVNGKEKRTLGKIDPSFQAKYARNETFDPETFAQLNCQDCHEPDVAVTGMLIDGVMPRLPNDKPVPTNNHVGFRPVEFAKHCIGCHDLKGLPHGLHREATIAAVERLIPFDQNDFLRRQAVDGKLVRPDSLDERQLRVRSLLSTEQNCLYCHYEPDEANRSKSLVQPSQIPAKWLPNAVFPHGAHLMVGCDRCHTKSHDPSHQAPPSNELAWSTTSTEVMIRNIDVCRECHIASDAERAKKFHPQGEPQWLATADCVDCHRYHVDPPAKLTEESKNLRKAFKPDIEALRLLLSRGPSP